MSCCLECGEAFEQLGSGRPRKRCFVCAPAKVQPKGDVGLSCAHCSSAFVGRANAKYCSRACGEKARELRRGTCCAGCGKLVVRSRTSAKVVWCLGCRRSGLAPSSTLHGTVSRYRRGCRCDQCTSASSAQHRRYRDRRKAQGKPIDYSAYRKLVAARCGQCDVAFMARPDGGARRFCSLACANDFQGRSPVARFRIARSKRLAIYEACGWVCQLCSSPVRTDVKPHHPRYPTLDHIVPRAHGGSDDESNLRLACFQCNTRRGTNVDWVPEAVVCDESARQIA